VVNRILEKPLGDYTGPIAPDLTRAAAALELTREPPATWACAPNLVVCINGHPLLHHKAGFHTNQRRIDGHVFHGCEKCRPSTFFFGDVRRSRSEDPIVYCHSITKAQYDYWNNEGADRELEGGTLEMLFLLGLNPNWRPQK